MKQWLQKKKGIVNELIKYPTAVRYALWIQNYLALNKYPWELGETPITTDMINCFRMYAFINDEIEQEKSGERTRHRGKGPKDTFTNKEGERITSLQDQLNREVGDPDNNPLFHMVKNKIDMNNINNHDNQLN